MWNATIVSTHNDWPLWCVESYYKCSLYEEKYCHKTTMTPQLYRTERKQVTGFTAHVDGPPPFRSYLATCKPVAKHIECAIIRCVLELDVKIYGLEPYGSDGKLY